MELRSLWWFLLVVAAVVGVAAYVIGSRRARDRARAHARPVVTGPTPEEEAYLDSSHIVSPVAGRERDPP